MVHRIIHFQINQPEIQQHAPNQLLRHPFQHPLQILNRYLHLKVVQQVQKTMKTTM